MWCDFMVHRRQKSFEFLISGESESKTVCSQSNIPNGSRYCIILEKKQNLDKVKVAFVEYISHYPLTNFSPVWDTYNTPLKIVRPSHL